MSSKKQSLDQLPKLIKDKGPSNKVKGRLGQLIDQSSTSSLPSLPSTPLIGDNRSLLSRTSSKRNRLKSQFSVTSAAIEAAINDERRTSSEPGNRKGIRHASDGSIIENGYDDLGRSISIGGKMIPTASTSKTTPLPSTPIPDEIMPPNSIQSRPRSNSVFVKRGSSEEAIQRSRNSGSSSDLRKDGIYGQQSLGDQSKRRSFNSGSVTSSSSPRWAGQLTHAVLELSQEINRLRGQGAVISGQTQNTSPAKSKSIFWNQSALRNGSLATTT